MCAVTNTGALGLCTLGITVDLLVVGLVVGHVLLLVVCERVVHVGAVGAAGADAATAAVAATAAIAAAAAAAALSAAGAAFLLDLLLLLLLALVLRPAILEPDFNL